MKLTLRELLRQDYYKNFHVLCGAGGLDRVVQSVTVMDAIDIHDWIQGHEILLTSGYIWKGKPKLFAEMIEKINARDAAAVFIKLGRFIHTLPPEAVETAERLNFPIVQMPRELLFLEVLEPVLSAVINSQAEQIRQSQEIHKAFIDIMVTGGEIHEILEKLTEICKIEFAFYNAPFDTVYTINPTADGQAIKEHFLEGSYNYPVKMAGRYLGSIIAPNIPALCPFHVMAVEHASTMLNLAVQRMLSNARVESRYRDGFVQDLILNNIKTREEVLRRGRVFGWDLSLRHYITVIVDVDDFKKQYLKMSDKTDSDNIGDVMEHIFKFTNHFLRQQYSDCMFTQFTDKMAYVLKLPDTPGVLEQLYAVCQDLKEAIAREFSFTVTIGVGAIQPDIMDVYQSYNQAAKCVKISREIYMQDHVMPYSDIGIYHFLDMAPRTAETDALFLDSIRRLEEYDRAHNADLLETMIKITENDWNLKKTAQAIFVHYNTIKCRFRKIEEILKSDLSGMDARLSMTLSVRYYIMTRH